MAVALYPFEDQLQKQRFEQMIHELRCIECKGQSIAESHTRLANDIKKLIHKKIRAGQSDEQIINFLRLRYGDAIHTKPKSLFLWVAPPVLFFVLCMCLFQIYNRAKTV